MKLSKYTKLNKLLATYSVKSKYCYTVKEPLGSLMTSCPNQKSLPDSAGRACLPLARGCCSCWFLELLISTMGEGSLQGPLWSQGHSESVTQGTF